MFPAISILPPGSSPDRNQTPGQNSLAFALQELNVSLVFTTTILQAGGEPSSQAHVNAGHEREVDPFPEAPFTGIFAARALPGGQLPSIVSGLFMHSPD